MVPFIKAEIPARIDDLTAYFSQSRGALDNCLTHIFCNQSALAILAGGGNQAEADLIRPFLARINAGSAWADAGYRNITHFFNPLTKRGLWNLPSAAVTYRQFVRQALHYGQKADIAKAMFYTGAAVHLLQDMCVPHHSCNLLFNGHAEYEHWVKARLGEYPLIPATLQPAADENIMDTFINNALLSCEYLDLVAEKAGEPDYKMATKILLPLAQTSTAKMLVWLVHNLNWLSPAVGRNNVAL